VAGDEGEFMRLRVVSMSEDIPTTEAVRVDLAAQLEGLLARPLECPSDVDAWRDMATEVESYIMDNWSKLNVEVPHQLLHYFCDADICLKDIEYRRMQESTVRNFITELRQ
jgi:hypothetical protein